MSATIENPVLAKYGGSSVAHPDVFEGVIEDHSDQRIIVVSAPGRQTEGGWRMTPLLKEYVAKYDTNEGPVLRDTVIDHFSPIFSRNGSYDARHLTQDLYDDLRSHADDRSFIVSRGEYYSAKSLAHRIGALFVDAKHVIKFGEGNEFGRAERELSRPHIEHLGRVALSAGRGRRRIIIPGYYGTDGKDIKLLPDGGSDRTGGIISGVLEWLYENWTDVDGVYSGAANKKILDDAFVLPLLTREETREGANGGTGILQGDTIIDIDDSDIDVVIKNTFNPTAPGTRITRSREWDPEHPITAVTGRSDLREITIRDMAMAPRIGYLRDLFTKFSDLKLSAEHLPSSKDSVSITTGISSDPKEAALQHKAIEQFIHTARQHLLTRSGSVEVVDQAVVYAVGEALRDPRIRTFAARDLQDCAIEAGVNIESVGNRKVPSLAFLVERDHVEPFAMKIHERLIAA